MIDFGKDLTIGEFYILDKEYNNSSIVKLIEKGNILGLIENPETGSKWRIMLNRLTPIKETDDTLRNS